MTRSAPAIGAAILAAALVAGVAVARLSPVGERTVPTARVQKGRVEVTVHANGELRASRIVQLFAPAVGGSLTIVRLAANGGALEAGEVIVEFDPAQQEFAYEQADFDRRLAEQEIAKAEAEAAAEAAEDEVALLKARFEVRRAELDAATSELVGAIEAQRQRLALEDARQRLAQLERDVAGRRETALASVDGLHEKERKARAALETARRTIDALQVRAPFDGFVTLRPNFMAFGGIVFSGAVMPEFRAGDAANPGQPVADLVDTSRLEVTAKLSEYDRANVEPGHSVRVSVDALPGVELEGVVRTISSVASRQMFEGGVRRFDIAVDVAGDTSKVRPGVSAALAIAGPAFEDALFVPRPAVFDVSGRPSVYLRTARGFEPRAVVVRAFTDTVAVLEGVDESDEIALVAPEGAPSAASSGGGRPAGGAVALRAAP
jgi:multidrug resistance efflux pump